MVAEHLKTLSSAETASLVLPEVQWEGRKPRWPQAPVAFAQPATLAAELLLHLGRQARQRIEALCWTS
jgi:hypothetical protein